MVRFPSGTLLLLLASACQSPTRGALPAHAGAISSDRLAVEMAGLAPLDPAHVGITLVLASKSVDPLWVTVTFETPDPEQRCDVTALVEPGESHAFDCALRTLRADRAYSVFIAVRPERADAQVVESHRMQLWFTAADVASFLEMLKARRT